jgi:hypothetical protein
MTGLCDRNYFLTQSRKEKHGPVVNVRTTYPLQNFIKPHAALVLAPDWAEAVV